MTVSNLAERIAENELVAKQARMIELQTRLAVLEAETNFAGDAKAGRYDGLSYRRIGEKETDRMTLSAAVAAFEKAHIEAVLRECHGNLTAAAERLRMPVHTIRFRLTRFGNLIRRNRKPKKGEE